MSCSWTGTIHIIGMLLLHEYFQVFHKEFIAKGPGNTLIISCITTSKIRIHRHLEEEGIKIQLNEVIFYCKIFNFKMIHGPTSPIRDKISPNEKYSNNFTSPFLFQ